MKKVVLFFIVSMFFVANANANNNANDNANGFYVGAKAGVSSIKGDYDGNIFESSAAKGSFAGGYKFSFTKFAVRAELEYDVYDKIRVTESYIDNPEYNDNYTGGMYTGGMYTSLNNSQNTSRTVSVLPQAQLHTIHANAYIDINTETIFTPYFGIGIGVGILDVALTNEGDSVKDEIYTGFSLQAMLGTSINIHKNIAIDVGFKMNYYDRQGDNKDLTDVSVKLLPKDLYIGLRYTF